MAVEPLTAASTAPAVIRTCIGCRRRETATVLLRVVAGSAVGSAPVSPVRVLPDPRRRAPGRGAWLHPDPECVARAERRRAFGRSLRVSAPIELSAVHEYIASPSGTSGRKREETR
jgi:hypothetical protein